ncbi:MAG: hypothetical protein K2Y21_07170 [Phycisphaerales bacterium]|nr:hypothetical protein [Phycisphaerales bacterium]
MSTRNVFGSNPGIFSQTEVKVTAWAARPQGSTSPVVSSSSAFAFAFGANASNAFLFGITDDDYRTGAGAVAGAGFSNAPSCGVSTTGSSVGLDAIAKMHGSIGVFPDFNAIYEVESESWFEASDQCLLTMFSGAGGKISFSTFPSGVNISYSIDISLTFLAIPEVQSPGTASAIRSFGAPNIRNKIAFLKGSSVEGIFRRINDRVEASEGWVQDSNVFVPAPSWNGYSRYLTYSLPAVIHPPNGNGGWIAEARVLQVDESKLDLNADGRFDHGDITWLNGVIPTTDPTILQRANLVACSLFDEECVDVVDAADVAAMQELLDIGLGSTPFGDRNGNGCVDCADAIHGVDDVDYLFDDVPSTSATYNIGLDQNGDGVVTGADRVAFYSLVNHADYNGDSLVDDADFIIFDDYYDTLTTAKGDQNGDGITDDADFVIFAVRYDELLCPTCN